jgi:hypothetical protein
MNRDELQEKINTLQKHPMYANRDLNAEAERFPTWSQLESYLRTLEQHAAATERLFI